jgi:universal stress protein E
MSRMFRKILVLVRGPDPAQPAVQRAVLLAGSNTGLALLDLVHEPMLDSYMGNSAIYEPLRARVVAERAEQVQQLVAVLQKRGLDVDGKAVWGHPLDEAVASEVRSQNADLVVIAPGSEAAGFTHNEWRLVSTCPAPVLVAKGPAPTKYRHIVAAVDPFHMHSKPGELDVAILAHAHDLQTRTRATLSALHCFVPFEYFGFDLTASVSDAFGADARREELEKLLQKTSLHVSTARVEIGPTHEVIKKLVDRGEADVVVMGVLARGRIKEWLIGSTAERVLHSVPVDVLAVKTAHPH